MRKAEIFKSIGATPDEVRYYEKKGFVRSRPALMPMAWFGA